MKLLTTPPSALVTAQLVTRILVVDDDEAIRRLTQRILGSRGYEVLTASDGAAAVCATVSAMAQAASAVHLVLTDIDMPRGDGYALGRQLAVRWPALPVIYMSGTTYGIARRAGLVGSEHFIEKPFSAPDLLLKIDRVLMQATLALPETIGCGD